MTRLFLALLLLAGCGPEDDAAKPGVSNNDTSNNTSNNTPTNNTPTNNATTNNATTNNATTNNAATNNAPTNNAATNNNTVPATNNNAMGGDTDEPVAIDTGSDPSTPGSYKGLPLALADNGAPTVAAVRGSIGVVCIGMSNGNQECSDYIDKLARNLSQDVNGEVVVVNCAVGGHAVERWNDPAQDSDTWDACLNTRLAQAGLSADQVRVVWHKAANQFTTLGMGMARPAYPDADADYFVFYDNLTTFADRVTSHFPALQAVYSTSRSYGGFSDRADRGEPLSYEEGHALNSWLADNPAVDGVWFGWGPYIWAPDCATGDTNGSGVCYVRADYQNDAVHPAQGARDKISQMLHDRWLNEDWYTP